MGKHIEVSRNYQENVEFLKEELGVGISVDMIAREFKIGNKKAALFFVSGLVKDSIVIEVMKMLMWQARQDILPDPVQQLRDHAIPHVQVSSVKKIDEAIMAINSGQQVLIVDGVDEAIIIDARMYPDRQPEEPDIERVVRGSRDGFNETILTNLGLIRRRVRDPKLRTELIRVGKRGKCDICLCYIKDIANPDLVDFIRNRIEEIKIDALPMAEKSVEELITPGSYWNPFPKVRYSERPDVVAAHLLEGHVAVVVDTSPSVIIAPTTFFHHVQHAEEYRQNPAVGVYLRWIRFAAIVASVILVPLWLLFSLQPGLLPPGWEFIGPKKVGNIPLVGQILIGELAIDLVRMAAIHTPTPLATSLAIIGALLMGEIATQVGLFAPEVILYMAIVAVGTFATPSYELAMANRLVRLFLLAAVALFKLPGFIVALIITFLFLALSQSFGIPYLWPLIPFNWAALKHILVRAPVPVQNVRPSILKTLDVMRQPAPARKPGPPQKDEAQEGKQDK